MSCAGLVRTSRDSANNKFIPFCDDLSGIIDGLTYNSGYKLMIEGMPIDMILLDSNPEESLVVDDSKCRFVVADRKKMSRNLLLSRLLWVTQASKVPSVTYQNVRLDMNFLFMFVRFSPRSLVKEI